MSAVFCGTLCISVGIVRLCDDLMDRIRQLAGVLLKPEIRIPMYIGTNDENFKPHSDVVRNVLNIRISILVFV
jgi:hypothetical protein